MRRVGFVLALIICVGLTAAQADTYRYLLVGDSWTQAEHSYGSINSLMDDWGLYEWASKGDVTAIGGTTADWWTYNLYLIGNELAANSTIDVVYMHLGGNDFLGGWHASMTPAQEEVLWAAIVADLEVVIDYCIAQRTGLRVLLSGYDYLNFVETLSDEGAMALWLLLGSPSANRINWALINLGAEKRDLCLDTTNAHYEQNWGLMQYVFGYPSLSIPPGYWPAPGTEPNYNPWPGGNPDYPSPPEAMGNGGKDPIHLNATGYYYIIWNSAAHFLVPWLGQACFPSPAHGATGVDVNADLSWGACPGATAHDVYFGTGGEYRGRTTYTTYDPGTMAGDTTYYWRIDEVFGTEVVTGLWWNFKTAKVDCGAEASYGTAGGSGAKALLPLIPVLLALGVWFVRKRVTA
ncbi:MAG TPA: SGNH/GDSL hydrolase family protein [Candidatus Hydrogenedentes bacterium]|nr:SGNH/GDSL hydrolase family protein [Candidatus Hydrogenedentota bacterium]HIJ73583.1 SGNH/GDSL hydrolase family protein [Candidatus Hydrogenedentota bacterium]